MKKSGYALVNALIIMSLVIGFEVFRYHEVSENRKMYVHLQNELIGYTMANMVKGESQMIIFNTGRVNLSDSKAPIKLNNGFQMDEWHKVS